MVSKWKKGGNEKLRYKYNLNQDSIVFDLGGYVGQWSSDIFSMYLCQLYIFEPVNKYYNDIKERFINNKSMRVYQFGLSGNNGELNIGLSDDGSSIYKQGWGVEQEKIMLKKASEFIKENGITKIDLMKINIEGGEYDLLEHLIESGEIKKIKNIQVQFHDFVPNAKERMKNIQKKLSRTHRTTYQFEFVWENWEINTL